MLVNGCSKTNGINEEIEISSKNITIHINDNQNNDQHYSLGITTDGKHTENIAVLPQAMFLKTDSKKQVKVKMIQGVSYTIKVYKTNAQSTQKINNKSKTVELLSQRDEPLAEVKFTPASDSNKFKIKVDSD